MSLKRAPPCRSTEELYFRGNLIANWHATLTRPGKLRACGQPVSSFHLDRTKLALHWNGPLRDAAGTNHDVSVRMDVTVAGGSLQFTLHVENRTACKVQEAWYPLVGGLTRFCPPGQPPDATLWLPTSTPTEKPLKLPFSSVVFGYPGQLCMSVCSIQSRSAGRCLYFSSQDSIARYKTFRFMELSSPEGERDVFVCIQHSPFTPAGGTFVGSPVTWRFLPGDWRAGGRGSRPLS
jgi:hypothetical protein